MNREEIEKALDFARDVNVGPQKCPVCGDEVYSPMDKLCLYLYNACPIHLEDDSHKVKNLIKISSLI